MWMVPEEHLPAEADEVRMDRKAGTFSMGNQLTHIFSGCSKCSGTLYSLCVLEQTHKFTFLFPENK